MDCQSRSGIKKTKSASIWNKLKIFSKYAKLDLSYSLVGGNENAKKQMLNAFMSAEFQHGVHEPRVKALTEA